MFCISTKYLGPTKNKGARIKATDGVEVLVVHFDYGMDTSKAMLDAALQFAAKIRQLSVVGYAPTCEYVGSAWVPGRVPVKAHLFR